jgi:hypothetical protein
MLVRSFNQVRWLVLGVSSQVARHLHVSNEQLSHDLIGHVTCSVSRELPVKCHTPSKGQHPKCCAAQRRGISINDAKHAGGMSVPVHGWKYHTAVVQHGGSSTKAQHNRRGCDRAPGPSGEAAPSTTSVCSSASCASLGQLAVDSCSRAVAMASVTSSDWRQMEQPHRMRNVPRWCCGDSVRTAGRAGASRRCMRSMLPRALLNKLRLLT